MDNGWLGWAAGIIDGEGSITLQRGRATTLNRRRTDQIALFVRAVNSNAEAMYKLRDLFGGSIGIRRPRKVEECFPNAQASKGVTHYLPQYTWLLTSGKAAAFLRKIRPWLVIKAPHAQIGLEFWKVCAKPPGWNAKGAGPALRLSDDEARVRQKFFEQMRLTQVRSRPIAVQQSALV